RDFHVTGVQTCALPIFNNFEESGTDFMEFRFAEVVLNLAECAIGINRLNEGLEGIMAIRERAGIENNDGSFGLADVAGDRNKLFKAILDERKVEFAYEGKRCNDLRRWLLDDIPIGDDGASSIPRPDATRRAGDGVIVKDGGSQYVGGGARLLGGEAPISDRDATTYPEGVETYEEYVG